MNNELLRKMVQIVLKDQRLLFLDRGALIFVFITPIVLTLVIGAAFSGFGSGGISIRDIKVALVNKDEGASIFFQNVNFGDILTESLVNPTDETLSALLAGVEMDEVAARAAVDSGEITAAIIVPADFSNSLNPVNDTLSQTTVEIYKDDGAPISASIVSSIVRGFVNGIAGTNIAVFTAKEVDPALALQGQAIAEAVSELSQNNPPIRIEAQNVSGEQSAGGLQNLLQFFAPSMAVFFLTFTMASSAGSLIEEQANGTLQRMIVSPTRRWTILVGKLAGTFVNGIIQMTVLILATSFIAPILGQNGAVWGNNPLALIIFVPIVVAAATGLGTLFAAVARDQQQAQVLSTAGLTLLGMLSGAFFFTGGEPPFGIVSQLTLNWWAVSGFTTIATTGDLAAVLPNIAALLLIFVAFFGIGVYAFSKRLDV
jgi:ABC-2 type transport system permease protein